MKRDATRWLGATLCCMILWTATPAQCQTVADAEVTKAQQATHTYFEGEKRGAEGFMAAGAVSIVAGLGLALAPEEVLNIAAVPTLAFGGIDMLLGLVVYAIADGRSQRLQEEAGEDLAGLKSRELERVRSLDNTFYWLYTIESVVLAGGIGVAIAGAVASNKTAVGVGLGLALQMPGILILDAMADARGEVYVQALEGVEVGQQGVEVGTGDLVGGVVGIRGTY